MSTFSKIKYMNGSFFFPKARHNMIGVSFKIPARTPAPQLPKSYPNHPEDPKKLKKQLALQLYDQFWGMHHLCRTLTVGHQNQGQKRAAKYVTNDYRSWKEPLLYNQSDP